MYLKESRMNTPQTTQTLERPVETKVYTSDPERQAKIARAIEICREHSGNADAYEETGEVFPSYTDKRVAAYLVDKKHAVSK